MESKSEFLIDPGEIRNLIHKNAESDFSHTSYRKELERFFLLAKGDDRAVEGAVEVMDSRIQGKLSDDPVRNIRYLFIVNTGLGTRVAIEAGVPQEMVYSASDVYIRKADLATTEEEIVELNREFWQRLVKMVRDSRKTASYSNNVKKCIDYITTNFNKKITLDDLAAETKLTPNYISTLFKHETGMTVGEYLIRFRTESAKALLARTDYSYLQIALSLGFCTQSYFTSVFKSQTGYTPGEYRLNHTDKVFAEMGRN